MSCVLIFNFQTIYWCIANFCNFLQLYVELTRFRVEEKVCPVRISLHVAEQKELSENQLQDGLGDEVPGLLRQVHTPVYCQPSQQLSCQNFTAMADLQ